jgi:integrase
MAVYKRGGMYWYHFVFDGRHFQKSAKTTNKRKAEQIEAAYKTQLAMGKVGIHEPKRAPKFSEAVKEFLEVTHAQQNARQRLSSYRRYETSSKALLRFYADTPLDSINSEDVEKFKLWRSKQTKRPPARKLKKKPNATTSKLLKPATVNRELACLKALFNYFIKNEVVIKNPVKGVKFFAEDNEQMRVVSSDEQVLYFMAASQPLRDIAMLMLETGMRPEEVCRMRREDVHLEQSYYFNPYGKTKAAKRKVPLSVKAVEIVERRLSETQGEYLFPGGRGSDDMSKPIVKVNNPHNRALKRSGVRYFRLYDLRHTWATRAAMAGVDLVTLAAMLGHSRIQMVLRYAHPTEEHQFQAMRKIEAFAVAK